MPVSTDLTIKSDSVLTNPMKKYCARIVKVIKHPPDNCDIVTLLTEGLPTKAREAPSPHEVM